MIKTMAENKNVTEKEKENPFAELEKDGIYNKWFNEGFNKKNTQLSYRNGLKRFCEFTDMQPSELINEAREDYINRVPPWELRHVKHAEEFLTFLKTNNGNLTNYTKLNYIKAVKHFFIFNKIPIELNDIGIAQSASERYLDIPLLKIEDVRKGSRYG